MPRKSSTRTTSSATTATDSTTPVFTSFAAVTAHALRAHGVETGLDADAPPVATAWDQAALVLLKKFSKRHITTKVRALSELREHIHATPESAGDAFLDAWPSAFVNLLDDAAASVREAALLTMADIVGAFGRRTQPTLPTTFPPWVAATGDVSPAVAAAAINSLDVAFPPPQRHRAAALRFASRICEYCNDTVARLANPASASAFVRDASRFIAALHWVLNATQDITTIAFVLDSQNDPLRIIVRGPPRHLKADDDTRPVTLTRAVADFAITVIRLIARAGQSDNDADTSCASTAASSCSNTKETTTVDPRISRIAGLAIFLARNADPCAWDIILILMTENPAAIAPVYNKLASALSTAAVATDPAALAAMCPLIATIRPPDIAPTFAKASLSSLSKSLFAKDSKPLTTHYLRAVYPSFVETVAYVQGPAHASWFGSSDDARRFSVTWFEQHSLPICRSFLSGTLPPISIFSQSEQIDRRAPKVLARASASVGHDFDACIAKIFRNIPRECFNTALPDIVKSLCTSLEQENRDEQMHRYKKLLGNIRGTACEEHLVNAVLQFASLCDKQYLVSAALIVSVTLAERSGSSLVDAKKFDDSELQKTLEKVMAFLRTILGTIRDGGSFENKIVEISGYVGIIQSWVIWAGNRSDSKELLSQVLNDTNEVLPPNKIFFVVEQLIFAHKERKDSGDFEMWTPLRGERLEEVVNNAINALADEVNGAPCVGLLSAAADAGGGASISFDLLRKMTFAVSSRLSECNDSNIFDPVITALLQSPSQLVARNNFSKKLTQTALFRSAMCKDVMDALLSYLSMLTTLDVVAHVESFWEIFSVTADINTHSFIPSDMGFALSRMISFLGDQDECSSMAICKKFLLTIPPSMAKSFLKNSSFQYVFGDGDRCEVQIEFMLESFQKTNMSFSVETISQISEYLQLIPIQGIPRIASYVTECELRSLYPFAIDMIKIVCQLANNAKDLASLLAISESILSSVPKGNVSEKDPNLDFARVPRLIRNCITENEDFVLTLEKVLIATEKVIRRDPSSTSAFVALDIFSSSIARHRDYHGGEEIPMAQAKLNNKWLVEREQVILRAVRRHLEQPRDLSNRTLETLGEHSARLVYYCVLAFGREVVSIDDIRFWTLRARNDLEEFIKRCNTEKYHPTESNCRKIAWNCRLMDELVDEVNDDDPSKGELVDEICHWGAWSTVYILPGSKEEKEKHPALEIFGCVTIDGCVSLILKAAERGVLLGNDGTFPVQRDHVYKLIPWLRNGRGTVRKAILTLIAHAAAIDLPLAVENRFPKEGFNDEAEEVAFGIDMIPQELRDGLRWTPSCENTPSHELGFFLTWRLFLDLLMIDDAPKKETRQEESNEEVSFRRIGVTYLRENSSLFEEFFRRSIDVLIEGSLFERTEAGKAGEEALRVEERAAQGIQLVNQTEEKETSQTDREESTVKISNTPTEELEIELGRAAGIAFARALQRLPALSRDFLGETVDRGTQSRLEGFVRKWVTPMLIAAEVRQVREWGAFGGGTRSSGEEDGEVEANGSVEGRDIWAKYTFSDVTLEIGISLPDVFPLRTAVVEPRSRTGMSSARWRKTLLAMTTLLSIRNGSVAEAIQLWRRNLDKTFQNTEECPICYSVLQISSGSLPKKPCRICHKKFHPECLYTWFRKSNSSACPLCRSAFQIPPKSNNASNNAYNEFSSAA